MGYGYDKRPPMPDRFIPSNPATEPIAGALPRSAVAAVKDEGGGGGLTGDGSESPSFTEVTAADFTGGDFTGDNVTADSVATETQTQTPIAEPSAPASGVIFYIDEETGLPTLKFANGLIRRLTLESPFDGEDPIPPAEYTADAETGYVASAASTFAAARAGSDTVIPVAGGDSAAGVQSETDPSTQWFVFRGFLVFDTTGLPATPLLGRVTAIFANDIPPVDDTQTYGLYCYPKSTPTDPLESADWAATTGSLTLASDSLKPAEIAADLGHPAVTWYLNAAGLAHIDDGHTWFVIRISADVSNTAPAHVVSGSEETAIQLFGVDEVGEEPTLYLEFV